MRQMIYAIFNLTLLVFSITSCITYTEASEQIRMELPAYESGSKLIGYTGYSVLFNEKTRLPLWVAYELTASETDGPVNRNGKSFRPDERVFLPQADNYDYRGSGWSRGHMAPAGDFKWDDNAMWDTFYYTNCCPQDETLNNGSWHTLEKKVRSLARKYKSVYVVTGPLVENNEFGCIGPHRVIVPDAFFKALLIYTSDGYHSVGFVMHNTSTIQHLNECCMSINELEVISGIDFFPALDDTIEETVEGIVDLAIWSIK